MHAESIATPTAGVMPLLTIEGVSRSFGGFTVLRNVSLDVAPGTITGLLGPNGSGKTTLFNILTGFLPPSGGRVRFEGNDLAGLSVPARSRLGLVRSFQTPKIFESLSCRDNVALGFYKQTHAGMIAGMLGLPSARAELAALREKAQALLERFGLQRHAEREARLLSAGQRRNLEMARALAAEPKILMLDEPSTGLTREEAAELGRMLGDLRRSGTTLFLVSHDMEFMRIVDCAHVLYFGEIIASGDLASVQADRKVRQIYLGT